MTRDARDFARLALVLLLVAALGWLVVQLGRVG